MALEDGEEQKYEADKGGEGDGGVEDPDVDTIYRDTQEGDDDGYLCNDASADVEDLSQPPALGPS